MPPDRRPGRRSATGSGPRPDALQRRGAGHGGLRDGAGRDPLGGSGRARTCRRLRRRNAAVPAGRAAHGVGADAGRHPDHAHHRQHGGPLDGARAGGRGDRRRGPHRGQRRRGEQDRNLLGGGAREGERRAVLSSPRPSRRSTCDTSGDLDPDRGAPARRRSRTTADGTWLPPACRVRNPAFDVTPHRYVTAIICERGIARAPYEESLRAWPGR